MFRRGSLPGRPAAPELSNAFSAGYQRYSDAIYHNREYTTYHNRESTTKFFEVELEAETKPTGGATK